MIWFDNNNQPRTQKENNIMATTEQKKEDNKGANPQQQAQSNKEQIENSPATQAVKRDASNTPIRPLGDGPQDNTNPSQLKQDIIRALEGAPISPIQQKKLDEVLAQHEAQSKQDLGRARNPYQANPHENTPHVLPAVLSPIVKETTSPGTLDRLEPTLAEKAEPNPVTAGEIPEVNKEAAMQGQVPVTQPQGNIQPQGLTAIPAGKPQPQAANKQGQKA